MFYSLNIGQYALTMSHANSVVKYYNYQVFVNNFDYDIEIMACCLFQELRDNVKGSTILMYYLDRDHNVQEFFYPYSLTLTNRFDGCNPNLWFKISQIAYGTIDPLNYIGIIGLIIVITYNEPISKPISYTPNNTVISDSYLVITIDSPDNILDNRQILRNNYDIKEFKVLTINSKSHRLYRTIYNIPNNMESMVLIILRYR